MAKKTAAADGEQNAVTAESAPLSATSYVLESWTVDRLQETIAAYNPRTISERNLNTLGKGIDQFGFLLPIVVNTRTNRMVGGHQRLKAAIAQQLTEVPVHLVDLDESKEKALNLALNKIEGKWDYTLLEEALTQVADADLLALSGFSETDLIEIMSGHEDEFTETFEEFAGRFAGRKNQDTVMFRSPLVSFTCSKSTYEALVQRLYSKVGVDDALATNRFFQIIGLAA